MLSIEEVSRLAAAVNCLRPDWPVKSLETHIKANHINRSYRDLACALAYIATDAQTQTPARLMEAGPWWRTTEESRQTPMGRRIPCPEHPDQSAGRCRPCATRDRATPEQIAAHRQRARHLAANPPSEEDQ